MPLCSVCDNPCLLSKAGTHSTAHEDRLVSKRNMHHLITIGRFSLHYHTVIYARVLYGRWVTIRTYNGKNRLCGAWDPNLRVWSFVKSTREVPPTRYSWRIFVAIVSLWSLCMIETPRFLNCAPTFFTLELLNLLTRIRPFYHNFRVSN